MALYTKEDLSAMTVHTLRVVLRTDFKGVPGVMNKEELIDKILSIQAGENPPVRSTKGRKPLDTFLTPVDVEIQLGDFGEFEGDVPSSVKGILEIHRDGYGFIRRNALSITSQDVYVGKPLIKKHALKRGDEIVGECSQMRDSGIVALNSVNSINGRANFEEKRQDILEFRPTYTDKKIPLYQTETPSLGVVDMFCPIGDGQRCIVLDDNGSRKTRFLKDLIRSLTASGKVVYLLSVCSKPEDVTAFAQSGCKVFEISAESQPHVIVRKVALATEMIKRKLETGENPVFVVTDLNSVIKAYNEHMANANVDKGFTEEGLTAHNLAIKTLNPAGNYGEKGSLTSIGVLKSSLSDGEFSDVLEVANCVITLTDSQAKRRGYEVDPLKSYTIGDENLLNAEQIAKADDYRAKLEKDDAFLQVILDDLNK